MFRNNQHVDLVTRHLVWIDAKQWKMAVMVWLISKTKEGKSIVADTSLRVVAPGTEEDRKIHVDGRSFFSGHSIIAIICTRIAAAWIGFAVERRGSEAGHSGEL